MIRPMYPVCAWCPWQAAVVPAGGRGLAGRLVSLAGTAPGRGRSRPGRRQARDDGRPARADGDVLARAITAPAAPYAASRRRQMRRGGMPQRGPMGLPMPQAPGGAMALRCCRAALMAPGWKRPGVTSLLSRAPESRGSLSAARQPRLAVISARADSSPPPTTTTVRSRALRIPGCRCGSPTRRFPRRRGPARQCGRHGPPHTATSTLTTMDTATGATPGWPSAGSRRLDEIGSIQSAGCQRRNVAPWSSTHSASSPYGLRSGSSARPPAARTRSTAAAMSSTR